MKQIDRRKSISKRKSIDRRKPADKRKLKRKGSMTLETALVLPLFLFVMFTLFSFFSYMELHMRMQTAMQQTAIKMAKYAYAYDRISEGYEVLSSQVAGVVISETYARTDISEQIPKQYLEHVGIMGGAYGISYLQSNLTKEDCIDLIAVYTLTPRFIPSAWLNFQMVNRAKTHKWTGYDNTQNAETAQEDGEQLVYVTETGTVYHLTRSCTYLALSVTPVSQLAVQGMQNASGEYYGPCELCGDMAGNGTVYITNHGNRYHMSVECSGLKRTVTAIPISEVGGRSSCSRCGSGR